jgi:alpha/beta superfamily hydrolase
MRWAPKRIEIPVAHGHLEALLQEPEEPSLAAVVCHPHPLMGGTMDNHVVYRLARGLNDVGAVVVRFNFRGVGDSTGTHADGVGEQDDATAALDFLRERHPSLPLWMAGFSFGARVGLEVGARDPRVVKLLGVGLALSMFDLSFLLAVTKPKAFIQGGSDEFAGAAKVEEFVKGMIEPKRLEIVPGASHLFTGKQAELEAAIARAIEFLQSM